jgi:hypothetical protein
MTKEQKDKILKALAEERNDYARGCQKRVEKEWGKIEGADYMLHRFLDILNTEFEPPQKSENSVDKKNCATCIGFRDKEYEQLFCHDCLKGIQNHYKTESEDKE